LHRRRGGAALGKEGGGAEESLLVGGGGHGHLYHCNGFVVHMGIVDMLQPYNCRKATENFIFSRLLCRKDISCQPAARYARRFLEFMKEAITDEGAL
jgi:hypothetical protein